MLISVFRILHILFGVAAIVYLVKVANKRIDLTYIASLLIGFMGHIVLFSFIFLVFGLSDETELYLVWSDGIRFQAVLTIMLVARSIYRGLKI